MEPTPEMIREIDRAKLEAARRMTFEERFLAGPDLFEFACEVSRDGIRMQFPDAGPEEVERILRDRIDRATKAQRWRAAG